MLASADDVAGNAEVVAIEGLARAAGRVGTEGVEEVADGVDVAVGWEAAEASGTVEAVAVAPARSQGFGGEAIAGGDGGMEEEVCEFGSTPHYGYRWKLMRTPAFRLLRSRHLSSATGHELVIGHARDFQRESYYLVYSSGKVCTTISIHAMN